MTDFRKLCTLHHVTVDDLDISLRLFTDAPRLDAAAALHAATALNRDIPTIISPDKAFDDITGLIRLDPVEATSVLARGPSSR